MCHFCRRCRVVGRLIIPPWRLALSTVCMVLPAAAHAQGGLAVVVLDPEADCTFFMHGNTGLVVADCTAAEADGGQPGCAAAFEDVATIQVNSASSCAACVNGTSVEIEADALSIAGGDPGLCVDGNPDLDIAEISTAVQPAVDPLRHIPPPKQDGMPRFGGIINEDGYFAPGYYPQGIRVLSSHTVCLGPEPFPCPPPRGFEPSFATPAPAIYVVDNTLTGSSGLVLDGSARLFAYQVMIYVKGQGIVRLNSNNQVVIIPADLEEGGLYGGISIFQAHDNAAAAQINGFSDLALQGALYFPGAELLCTGTGIPLGNQLISRRLEIAGTGEWNIDYDGRFAQPYCQDPDGDGRFTICHHPPGYAGHTYSITVLAGELADHLAHGDQCEACPWETATPPATTTHKAPP